MGMIRSIRLMHGLLDGTIDAPALETLLASGGRSGDFLQLMTIPAYAQLLSNSLPAVQAIIASASPSARAKAIFLSIPAAVLTFIASPVAGPEIAKLSSALTSVLGVSGTATRLISGGLFAANIAKSAALTTAFLNVQAARRAVWDSDAALNTLSTEATALAGAKAATGYVVTTQSVPTTFAFMDQLNASTRRILLTIRSSYSSQHNFYTQIATRKDTSIGSSSPPVSVNGSTQEVTWVYPWLGGGQMNNNATSVTAYFGNLPVTA